MNHMRRLPIFALLIIGALLFLNNNLAAQYSQTTHPGTTGYEQNSSTVSYSDMLLYDATHPDTDPKNPLNPMKHNIPESEFNHSEIPPIPNYGTDNTKSKTLSKRMKSSNIASPTPDTIFAGLTQSGQIIPPDIFCAVGPNHILQTFNTQVKITSKTGVQSQAPVSLTSFWSSLGGGMSCFDPKCVYDPYTNRYIVTALSLNAAQTVSYLLIGASATNDPTGTWHLFRILIDATGANWLDYPELGFNKNWIVVNGNLFNNASGAFAEDQIFIFNKANILAGTNAQHTLISGLTSNFCICPAFTYDATMNDLFCLETADGPSAAVTLFKISGTPTAPVFSTVTSYTGTIPWENNGSATGADTGPQSGTTHKIAVGDDRISSCVYRNNYLWFAHNAYLPVGNPTRVSVAWWQVDTVGNIIQNNLIDDATAIDTNYVYPSVAVNQANDMVVGYSMLASNMHPSCAFSYRGAADAINTMRNPYMYKGGTAYYYQTLGGPKNRWGDYSATCVDPSDNQTFFTLQEYCTGNTLWNTEFAKIYQCNVPPPAPIMGPSDACTSGTTLFYVNPAPWATSYTWTITGTGWSGSSTTDSIYITAGTGSAVLKVTVNNPCGSSIADSITITANASPITVSPGTITYDSALCQGTIVWFKTTPISGITDYVWTIVAGTGWAGTSTVDSIPLFVGSTSLTLTVAGVNGCGAGPAAARPNMVPRPIYTSNFSINNASPVQGQQITATYTGNAPINATYNWTYPLGTATPGGTVQGPQHIYWTTIGQRHVSLTVYDSGCTSIINTHSLTVGLSGIHELKATALNIQVYPNPSDGNFYLDFKDVKHEELTIELIDLLGQVVYHEAVLPPLSSFTKTIHVGTLPAGIYWLNIKGQGTTFTDKIFIK